MSVKNTNIFDTVVSK